MIRKSGRIPRSRFAEVLRSRGSRVSQHFILRFVEVGANPPQSAVSVSKKVSKSAVIRNRIRRRVYAALPPASSGLHLIIAKPGAEKAKGEELREELAELFKKG